MERLVLRLLLGLLKLLFQLVVFVATGAWPKFAKRAEQQKPARGQAKPPRAGQKRARGEQTARTARAPKPSPASQAEGPWPFEFAAELVDPEPDVEDGRADAARKASLAVRRARAKLNVPALTSIRGERRSLTSALRDRRAVREALLLGAALAPRTSRGPRH